MGNKTERISSLSLIAYSSLLILICEIFLSRISYQLYAIFVPLPFLFIGLLVSFINFSITISLCLFINFILNVFFPGKFIPPQFIVFNLSVSIISILFFYLSNQIKKKISISRFISIINIFFVIVLSIFYFLFFGGSEESAVKEYLYKLITDIFESYNLNQNQDVDEIVSTLVMILPSMNILLFMVTFSLNYAIANLIVRRLDLIETNKIDLSEFYTPIWFSLLYLIFFMAAFVFNESSIFHKLALNSLICMSFSYLIEGYILSGTLLKKIKTHSIIKFLIIFLLFLFLGYVLLLIIITLGIYRNIRNNLERNS